jgi:hypothetical protein
MSQDAWILLMLRIVLISGAVSVTVFIGVYSALARWWSSAIGRTIVIKDILLLLLLIPSLMSLFFQFNRLTSHIAAWVDVGLFALMTATMIWRCAVWIRIHREENADSLGAPGDDGAA